MMGRLVYPAALYRYFNFQFAPSEYDVIGGIEGDTLGPCMTRVLTCAGRTLAVISEITEMCHSATTKRCPSFTIHGNDRTLLIVSNATMPPTQL